MSEFNENSIEITDKDKYSNNFKSPFKIKNPNHIKFNKKATVVLIPVIEEYKCAGLFNSIWYSALEMRKIQESYLFEQNLKKNKLLLNQQFC